MMSRRADVLLIASPPTEIGHSHDEAPPLQPFSDIRDMRTCWPRAASMMIS